MNRYHPMSAFSLAFSAAYKGFMAEHGVTGQQIAKKLDRNTGYVSERVNGKRPLDTEDVDALAMLAAKGWTGKALMLELARRAQSEAGIHQDSFAPADVSGMTDDELSNLDLPKSGLALAATHDTSTVQEQSHPADEDYSQDTED